MIFYSPQFFLFVAPLLLAYRFCSVRGQNTLLLVANLLFLLSWGLLALVIHLICASAGYHFGGKIENEQRPNPRRWLLFLSIAFLMTPLVIFKLGLAFIEPSVKATENIEAWRFLPVGISYYTLQILGYVFAIYRKQIRSAAGLNDFLLFSSFFPQVLMGPIETYSHMRPQFSRRRQWQVSMFREGLLLIALGFFKKLVIADRLYPLLAAYSAKSTIFSLPEAWTYLAFCFFQIFCDFSAYVDMARGVAKMFSIELIENFHQPYFSKNIGEIWARWHVSLVEWVRTWIFWPLLLRYKNIYLAVYITFFSIGMWHGFLPNFVAWSCYWSALYFGHLALRHRGVRSSWLPVGVFLTFSAMSLSTVVFLARSMRDLQDLIHPLLRLEWTIHLEAIQEFISRRDLALAAAAIFIVIGIETLHRKWLVRLGETKLYWFSGLIALLAFLTVAFGVSDSRYFIYMRY